MRAPEAESYNQPFALGKPMGTLGVSKVIRSDTDDFKKGDLVYGFHSLQEYNVFPQVSSTFVTVRDVSPQAEP